MRFAPPGKSVPPPPPAAQPAPVQAQRPPKTVVVPLRALIASGALVAAVLAVLVLWRPAPPPVTEEAFNKSVEAYLKKRPADPTPANIAFASIQPSLVLIKVDRADSKAEGLVGVGGGVIVEETGTILTCLHVIEGGESIHIVFADGFETAGIVVSTQPENDLAVLRPEIVPEDLIPATFGSSDDLNLGDAVVAVGHPFGLVDSVSQGVVSGLGRTATAGEDGRQLNNLIQFDAAVNPGNSGGPLLNRNGEVVGLVTALFNPTKESFFVGVGYAITIETAGRAIDIPPW